MSCGPVMSGEFIFKVGVTNKVRARRSTIQSTCPFHIKNVWFWDIGSGLAAGKEIEIHETLTAKKLCGEWFVAKQLPFNLFPDNPQNLRWEKPRPNNFRQKKDKVIRWIQNRLIDLNSTQIPINVLAEIIGCKIRTAQKVLNSVRKEGHFPMATCFIKEYKTKGKWVVVAANCEAEFEKYHLKRTKYDLFWTKREKRQS